MSTRTLRRRSRPSLAARVRTFWIVGLLVLVPLGLLGLAFVRAPQLRIASFVVNAPPAPGLDRASILAAANIAPDANLWLIDKHAAERRIAALPYALTARLSRSQFPSATLTIDVTRRTPVACVALAGATVAIDSEVRVLQRGCPQPGLPLVLATHGKAPPAAPETHAKAILPASLADAEPTTPPVTAHAEAIAPPPGATLGDPDARELAALAQTIQPRVALRSIGRDQYGGIDLVDGRGLHVYLGNATEIDRKLGLIEPVRKSMGNRHRLVAIDLRAPDTPTVDFATDPVVERRKP